MADEHGPGVLDGLLQSLLWGLGRSLRAEYPDWQIRLVELSGEAHQAAEQLFQECLAADSQAEVGWRGQQRYTWRLQQHRLDSEAAPLSLGDKWLITGGLGNLGLKMAEWLVPQGVRPEACDEVFVANLKSVAKVAAAKGVRLLLEPLNTQDVPGYLHTRTAHTRRIIEAVGSDNVRMQYDLYHMQIMEGNLAEGLRRNWDIIGHIQFSSVPGRHEPQHGEVNVPFMFDVIDQLGYKGWIGCEYGPKTTTLEGLVWGKPYGIGPR